MKKNKIKYFRLLIIAGLVFALQSCLKNNEYYVDFSKGAPALELPLAAVHANGPIAISFDLADTPTIYYAVINVASVNIPTSDVTGTLALDETYLTQYNADQTDADPDFEPFELMPDSSYQVTSWDLKVSPGQRQASMTIKIFTNKIAPGNNYILPLTIVKSSIAISNWNHLMLNIGAKNQFDGKYTVTGTFVHTNAAYTANYPKTVGLVTQGLATDAYFDYGVNGGTFGYGFLNAGNGSYFGNWAPVFTFDADGNVTKVTNYYSDPAPRSRDSQLDTSPGTVNKYDIANKTMDVSYYFIQSGGIVAQIHEIWKYKGAR